MIVLNDFVVKKIGSKGRQDRFYKTYCNNCSQDRGYLLKFQDKRPTCNKCSKVGSTVPQEVREKMSAAAHIRSPRIKKQIDGRSISRIRKPRPDKVLTDTQKKIRHNVRTLVHQKLINRGLTKNNKTFNSLGYSPEELIKHLESKFQPGMTWDNYGPVWHIDHITPDSWFTYSSMYEQGFKDSWSLNNLQPLWAGPNHSKGNRYSG